MLILNERRKIVTSVIIAEIGRFADHNSPRRHPFPEFILGMAFQSPFLRIAAVMNKERRQHIRIGHNPQELGVIAKFHKIVWRGCRARTRADEQGACAYWQSLLDRGESRHPQGRGARRRLRRGRGRRGDEELSVGKRNRGSSGPIAGWEK